MQLDINETAFALVFYATLAGRMVHVCIYCMIYYGGLEL